MIWLTVIYAAGFLGVLFLNVLAGPVTVPLSLLRAIVWPIWLIAGWPQGERIGPD